MTPDHVFDSLWFALYAPGFFWTRFDGNTRWISTADRASLRRSLRGSEILGSRCEIHPVPRYGLERTSVADSSVLWARAETGPEAEALLTWSPKPTFIFREGDTVRHTAIWALTGQLDKRWTLCLNKRLAHAIGTAKKHADPENFYFTPPGSLDEKGKSVQIIHFEPTDYSAKALAGHLPDAPDAKLMFRQRQQMRAAA